ncbi:MAG: hypothetical protein J6P79_11110 [Pseudobutyrivibrio sp.]|nr:hypothetical protein [Pseudobutyrivibrio sp.]
MKKLFVLLLCSFMLVGCGKSAEVAETNNESTDNQTIAEAQNNSEATASDDASAASTETEDVEIPDYPLDLDISSCDTFTQIVDKVLEPPMAYTNEAIGDTDALLVSTFAYDNMDGNMASIDANVYVYKDGVPTLAGSVTSIGTAYPLAVANGILYVGIGHGTARYTITDNELVEIDSAWIEYAEDGSETYYYSENGGEAVQIDNSDKLDEITDEYFDAKVLNFDVIK